MRRYRAEPRAPKPGCCPARGKGKCEQHKHGTSKGYMRTPYSAEARQVLDDMIEVWGMGSIWDHNGYPIASFRALDDDDHRFAAPFQRASVTSWPKRR
jgi:hypothetical protein